MYSHTHTHTHTQISIHSYTAEIQSGSVHNENAPDMVLMMLHSDPILSFLEESKPVLCLKALGYLFKKKRLQEYMNYSSLRRVLFSSLSDPSLDVTCAVLLLSLFQSLNSAKRLHN